MSKNDTLSLDIPALTLRALVVPTALSLMLQIQSPAAHANNRGEARMNDLRFSADGAQSRREFRQMQRLERATVRLNTVNVPRFDMRSARDVVSLTQNDLRGANSVQLMLGNVLQEFRAGDRVSAAEFVAIKGGDNNIVLDGKGRAQSGLFSLNSLSTDFERMNVGRIVIPENITALGNFSDNGSLNVLGDLVNRGSIYGYSTNAANLTGTLSANNIINTRSGVISSVTPGELTSISSQAVADFSLELNAAKDIVNAGRITSGGSLKLIAGNSITNALLPGETGSTPVLQATHAVNLTAGSGAINNAGLISSLHGDINIQAQSTKTALAINGVGGTFNASNGNINIRDAASLDAGDVTLSGGDYLSQNLNIFAYQGDVNGNLGQLTGHLNTYATTAHVYAQTDTLTLGSNCITGDPTFVNTAGGIVIDGVNKFTQAVAIIANGDITAANGAQIVNPGGSVILIAGAKATTTGANSNKVPGTEATKDVVVSFDPALGAGGNIDLSTGAATTVISTNGTDGGDVTLVALASKAGNGGKVLLGNSTIDTRSTAGRGSSKGSDGGDVTIFAGRTPASSEDTITVGSIRTGGAASSKAGVITLATQQAVGTGPNNSITINPQGKITVGAINGSGITADKASILISGELVTVSEGGYREDLSPRSGGSGGAINITAGDSILAKGHVLSYGSGGFGGGTDNNDGGNGGAINISSKNGNITIEGQTNSSGGGGAGGGIAGDGGKAADIVISANKGSITLGAVYAVDGAKGGKSGGGGGSYGGGGGGDDGSGGGGGFFGGGGGSLFNGGGAGFSGGQGGAPNPPQKAGGGGGLGVGGAGSSDPGFYNGGAGGGLGGGGFANTPAKGVPPTGAQNGSSATTSNAKVTITSQNQIVTTSHLRGGVVKVASIGTTDGISLGGDLQGFSSLEISTNKGSVTTASEDNIVASPVFSFKSNSGSFGVTNTPIKTAIGDTTVDTGSGGGPVSFVVSNLGNTMNVKGIVVRGANGLVSIESNTINKKGGKIVTESLVLKQSNNGGIDIDTEVKNLKFLASGGVSIQNTGELFIDQSSAGGNIAIDNKAASSGGNGTIHLLDSLTAISGSISLTTNSGIVQDNPSAIIETRFGAVNIVSTGTAPIGAVDAPIKTFARSLSFNTGGSLFLQNKGNLIINKSSAVDTAVITTVTSDNSGRITIGSGNEGGIKVTNPSGKETVLTLQSSSNPGGTGGILWNAPTTESLQAGRLTLSDGADFKGIGGIGTEEKPILTKADKLSVNTGASATINNTGSVALLESVLTDNASKFVLTSTGSITGTTGKVTSLNVILVAPTGSIGSASAPVLVSASNLTATAISGSVFIENSTANPINLAIQKFGIISYENKAKGTYSISAPNTAILTNQEAILEPEIIKLSAASVTNLFPLKALKSIEVSATTGNVSLNQAVTAPSVTLSALTDTKTIVQTKDGIITALDQLTLNVADKGVASLQDFNNRVSGLATNVAGDGQVLFRTVNDLKLGAINGDGQRLTLFYTGNLTTDTNGSIKVGPLTFTPTGIKTDNSIDLKKPVIADSLTQMTASGTGGITIRGGLTGIGDKELITAGKGTIDLKGALSGNQVTLTTNGGDVTQTDTGILSAQGVLILNMNNGGTTDLSKAANNFVVFRDTVNGAGVVKLNTSKTLVLDQVKGVNQTFTATSDDTIVTPNIIEAKALTLTAKGAGGIASDGARLNTTATDLQLNATNPVANVFATTSSTSPVSLKASSAGQIFDLETAGALSVNGGLGAKIIKLTSNGTGGINIASIVGKAGSIVSIEAKGTGAITTQGAISSVHVEGSQIDLKSAGGSITGKNAGSQFITKALTLTANTSGTGLVNINNNNFADMILNDSSSGAGFTLNARGHLQINSITTNAPVSSNTGSITVTTTTGGAPGLTVNNGSQLTANGGNILLQAGTKIFIGSGAKLLASSTMAGVGNVTLITNPNAAKAVGTPPPNVQVLESKGGKVYFGTVGITAGAPDNILNAEGRDIIFKGTNSQSITLGGGVNIKADPPAGSAKLAAPATDKNLQSTNKTTSLNGVAVAAPLDSIKLIQL